MSIVRKGAIALFVSSIGGSFLRILFTGILARILSPLDFGLMATAMIITGFANLFVQFGFGQGLVQKKKIVQDDVSTAYLGSVFLGVFFGLIIAFSAPYIALFFEQPELTKILRYLAFLFPIKSFCQVQFSLLQRNMHFKKLAGRDVLSYFIGYGMIGIILAYRNFGVYALVYALLAQAIIYSILLSYGQREYKIRLKYNKKSFLELYTFGKNFTLSKIWNYFAVKGDYFIVSKTLGVFSLGFYSKAYGLMNVPNNIIGSVLNTVLFANYSKNQENKVFLTKSIKKGLSLLFFIALPVTLVSILLAKEIVLILLGSQWSEAVLPFQVLSVIIVFRIGYKIFGTFVKGIGEIKAHANIQFMYFIFVLIGSYIGSFYGIEYVATGTSIAVIFMFLMLLNLTIKHSYYSWNEFFKLFFSSVLFCIIVSIIPLLIYQLYFYNLESPILKFLFLSLLMFLSILFFSSRRKFMRLIGGVSLYTEVSRILKKINL